MDKSSRSQKVKEGDMKEGVIRGLFKKNVYVSIFKRRGETPYSFIEQRSHSHSKRSNYDSIYKPREVFGDLTQSELARGEVVGYMKIGKELRSRFINGRRG